MGPLRIGILGAARIAPGAVIKPIKDNADLAAKAQIVSVAARDQKKAAKFAAEHGIPATHSSYEAMLADDAIDAVYNPLPNSRHAELTIMALQAGKHVLCEKPFTNNAAEAIAVQRASEDAGCIAVEAMHPLLHPVAKRARELVLGGDLGKLVHIDVQFVVNFSGYDEGVRSAMHEPTPMFEDQRFNSELGGGAMMDLGCYCISALRNLANEEPRCTSALPDKWSEDEEIDLGMSADLVYPSGATAHFDCSFVGGDKAGPVVVTVTGSKGSLTIEGYNGGGNRANALTLKIGDAEPTVETVDSPPNSRSTMYYQLSAFVDEVRACEALPADQRAKPWTYSLKPSPADAVANMAVIDNIYRMAGMAPRRTTAPLPRPAVSTVTTITHPDGTSVVVSTSGGAAL